MNIYYDNIIFSLQKSGGISRYWFELSNRLIKENKSINFIESSASNYTNVFRSELDLCSNKIQMVQKLPLKIERYFSPWIHFEKPALFHSSYYRSVNEKGISNIVTVHDFTYEFFRKGAAKHIHYWQKKMALKQSSEIICVSNNTKKDLLKIHSWVDEKKVKVIYNGVGDEFFPIEHKTDSFDKYIIYVGDRKYYKNFDIAVKALAIFDDAQLLFVGGGELATYEKELLHKYLGRKYKHITNVSSEGLNRLYNNAYCLIYPSRYEGFGLPPLEAMKAGCPVLTSNYSSIPEVVGDAGLLVNDLTPERFADGLNQLVDNDFRQSLIERGLKQSAKFSWNKCFEETYALYEKIWKSNR